uniref:Lesueurin n=1 Tax=Ranoidea lesueuri TaxID=95134 RepID=LES_RANLE|nr:RecName: Full=Lesueurin [Litoria lesueurii]
GLLDILKKVGKVA